MLIYPIYKKRIHRKIEYYLSQYHPVKSQACFVVEKNFVVTFMGDGTYRIKTDENIIMEPAIENTTTFEKSTTRPVTLVP